MDVNYYSKILKGNEYIDLEEWSNQDKIYYDIIFQ